MALVAAVGLCACDDDKNKSGWPVPQPVLETMHQMYPAAQNVNWYRSGTYAVARFHTLQNGAVQSRWAWFDNEGTWYMTETDVTLAQMPQPVQEAFSKSVYAAWEFEDGDFLERAGMSDIYVIEAETDRDGKKNDASVALYYTADGSLAKTVFNPAEDYHYSDFLPVPLPASVSAFIQSEYPAAQLIASYLGQNLTRVEILDSGVQRTLWFNGDNRWLYTVTQISQAELPAEVATAFDESAYSDYTVLGTFYYNTPGGNYYRLALQSAGANVEIDITPDGQITVVNK